MRRTLALLPALLAPFPAAAQAAAPDAAASLSGACFFQGFDARDLARHAGLRVAAISLQFQSFEGSLLAGGWYKLRYGTKFAFSGDCAPEAEGNFLCQACRGASCDAAGATFRIVRDGSDTIKLVNDITGISAQNAAGGRDRLERGGAHAVFDLRRAEPNRCAF